MRCGVVWFGVVCGVKGTEDVKRGGERAGAGKCDGGSGPEVEVSNGFGGYVGGRVGVWTDGGFWAWKDILALHNGMDGNVVGIHSNGG
jgi:hypothetical protein